jgi:hypothetical protein
VKECLHANNGSIAKSVGAINLSKLLSRILNLLPYGDPINEFANLDSNDSALIRSSIIAL